MNTAVIETAAELHANRDSKYSGGTTRCLVSPFGERPGHQEVPSGYKINGISSKESAITVVTSSKRDIVQFMRQPATVQRIDAESAEKTCKVWNLYTKLSRPIQSTESIRKIRILLDDAAKVTSICCLPCVPQ